MFIYLLISIFIMPGLGYFACLKSGITLTNIVSSLYFSIVFYICFFGILTFIEPDFQVVISLIHALNILIVLMLASRIKKINYNRQTISWPKFISIVSFILIILFYNFSDIYQDSVAHLGLINQLKSKNTPSNVSTNRLVNPFKDTNISNTLINEEVQTINFPTYDIKAYHSLLAFLSKKSNLSSIEVIKFVNQLLLVIFLLSCIMLSQNISSKYDFSIGINVFIFVNFILKNYYGYSTIGVLPYNIVNIWHPTNVSSNLFFVYMVYLVNKVGNKFDLLNFVLLLAVFIASFLVHKIILFLFIPYLVTILLSSFLINKKVNIQYIYIGTGCVLLLVLYYLYKTNLPSIYNFVLTTGNLSNSGTNKIFSSANPYNTFQLYGIYLENTVYKLINSPIYIMIFALFLTNFIGLIRRKSILVLSLFFTFVSFLIPGVNFIIVQFGRAFYQRLSTVLLAEITLSYFINEKLNRFEFKKTTFSCITFILVVLTIFFDDNRSGLQKYKFTSDRLKYQNYILIHNISLNEIAFDYDTGIELNANFDLNGKLFSNIQDRIVRERSDGFLFWKKYHELIYSSSEVNTFINFAHINNFRYLLISKRIYKNTFTDELGLSSSSNIINENKDRFKVLFEDSNKIFAEII